MDVALSCCLNSAFIGDNGAGGSRNMNTSPTITKALIEARHRDLLLQAGRARLAREEAQASRDARESGSAPRPAPRRRWWLSRVPGLFGVN